MFYSKVQAALRCATRAALRLTCLMYGFYLHFHNLRFNKTQSIDESSAAHVVISIVSSEQLRCRLLKRMLDRSMNVTTFRAARRRRRGADRSVARIRVHPTVSLGGSR